MTDTSVYSERLRSLAGYLTDRGVDAAVITPGRELRYLLGLEIDTHERLAALVVTPNGPARMVIPGVDAGDVRAANLGDTLTLVPWNDGDDPYAAVIEAAQTGALSPEPSSSEATDDAHALRNLHLAVSDPTPFYHVDTLVRTGQKCDVEVTCVPLGGAVPEFLIHKTPDEVAGLRGAAEAIDRVFLRIPAWLQAGRTESEVAADIHEAILEEGHVCVDFVIVAAGPHGADPHHSCSDTPLKPGDLVVIDIGGEMPTGYRSDCTRMFRVPGLPDNGDATQADPGSTDPAADPFAHSDSVVDLVHRAHDAAIEKIRPGVTAQEIDRAARAIIEEAGYGEYFTHRTGHGIGLSVHEAPFIVEGNDQPLELGMCFSIEPGVYIPGKFGVRIEDIVTVTGTGVDVLNDTSRSIVMGSTPTDPQC